MRTVLFFIAFVAQTLVCSSPAEAEDDLAKIVDSNLKALGSIQSVHCTFSVDGRNGEAFTRIANGEIGIKRNQILFDYIQKNGVGDTTWSERYTWDGKQAADFFRSDSHKLAVYSERVACQMMEDRNVLLDPFLFLLGERDQGAGTCLTLAELSQPQEWERWTRSAQVLRREKLNGDECILVQSAGRETAPRAWEPYTMLVWFDADHGCYPVQWQEINKDNKVVARYRVTSVGYLDNNTNLSYPKVVEVYKLYASGTVSDDIRLTVTSLQNNADIPASQFEIDPQWARSIWNGATKKWKFQPGVGPLSDW